MSTEFWELGVVDFYDSFEYYDQFTQLATAYEGKDKEGTFANKVSMDTSVVTDFRDAPFHLCPRLGKKTDGGTSSDYLLGSEIILGPSSHTTYSGAIEKASISSFSGTTYAFPYIYRDKARTYVAYPSSQYAVGDQVIIRTIPLGWSAYGTGGVFKDSHYGIMPINRFDTRQGLPFLEADPDYFPGLTDYSLEYCKAVRLFTNLATALADTNQYIYRSGGVNSFSPRMRRWRASWYYRLCAHYSGYESPSAISAGVSIGIQTADGSWVTPEDTLLYESGNFETTTDQLKSRIASYSARTTDWVLDTKYISPFSSDDNDWTFNEGTNLNYQASNRGNRWGVQVGLFRGVNTAFDVDDLIIEHAMGTSHEENGYFYIEDFPDPESIHWEPLETFRMDRLANNSLHMTAIDVEDRPKWRLSADFANVSTDIYEDLKVLEKWVRQRKAIALRPKISGYPPVLVGVIRVRPRAPETWSLNRVSFTLEFEEK